MTWLGLLLIGIGCNDLVFSWLRRPRVAEAVAAGVALTAGLLAGISGPLDLLALVLVIAGAVAWGESVTYGFGSGRFALPLWVLASVLALAILASPALRLGDGLLDEWLTESTLPLLSGLEADRALLLLGALLVQLSTGNVIVRLVLGVTGTSHPLRSTTGSTAGSISGLKGGRLLGPMERLLIVGLGLAGEVTAASIVIAAKGLLRFPELQSARADGSSGPGIHEVTEYFLVGSFVSWTVSLAALALVAIPG